jgi:hypothetical protein
MLKKIFALFVFATIAFSSLTIVSAEKNSEVSEGGSLYYTSEKLETVETNVEYVGKSVIYKGDIEDNLYAFGESIQVDGNVKGDVLIIAANVIINGDIAGDIRVGAYNVYINSAKVDGDIVILAVNYGLSKETEVGGSIYSSSQRPNKSSNLPSNATELEFREGFQSFVDSADFESAKRFVKVVAVVFGIILFLGNLILSYLVLRFFPAFSDKIIKKMQISFLNSTAIGLTLSVLSPFVAIILFFSLIGLPVLMMLSVLFVLSSIISWIYFKYISGDFILKTLGQKTNSRFIIIVVGSLAVDLLFVLFTILGGLGGLLSFLVGITVFAWLIGSVVLIKFGK